MKTPGLNLIFKATIEGASFPSFDSEFLVRFDRYWSTYRVFVGDAFRDDLHTIVNRCEESGYGIVNFSFAVWEEETFNTDFPAAAIWYQRIGFFEASEEKTWQGNENRRIEVPEGAAIVEAANEYIFVEELAEALQAIRGDLEWMPVATIDKYKRDFVRLVTRPEHSFLSPATVLGEQWALVWVASSAEPPDDLFFDRIAIGPKGPFHPLIASRGVALNLAQRFPGFPLTPVLPCNSETGKAVVRVCELLKSHIGSADQKSATRE